jgi:hypothetical protein
MLAYVNKPKKYMPDVQKSTLIAQLLMNFAGFPSRALFPSQFLEMQFPVFLIRSIRKKAISLLVKLLA